MIQGMIEQAMEPLVQRIAEMESELEDLRRRADNHNRIGTIESVDAAAGTCTVSHGELKTPPVKWFNPSAGEVSETRVPSVGEQCVLINYGGGDGGAHTAALCGLTSDKYPAPSAKAEVRKQVAPDGSSSSYDHGSSEFEWVNGPATVKASREVIEVMLGPVGLKIDAEGVHVLGPLLDHNGKDVGFSHQHINSGGIGLGGIPQ